MKFEFDPYTLLGVHSNANMEDIKQAYRRAVRRLHPDANQNNPGAVVQFQDITTAYELLENRETRDAYDRYLERAADRLRFSMQTTSSKRAIAPLTEPQVLYMLADILPDKAAQDQKQQTSATLNLTLILDRSNSMNGPRLERVKIATHQIIDQLKETDILSVIAFNDRAEVIIESTLVGDKAALKARVSMMIARGGTEIYHGLVAGVEQNRRYLGPKLVNHLILLTDGNTFGDEELCVRLAKAASREGMIISAMGLGHEWNDEFLDHLASTTGGTCSLIRSSSEVVEFLNNHVRGLSNMFAERMAISVAPDIGIRLESAFKLSPSPQPLPVNEGYIQLGGLQANRPISVLFQFELPPNLEIGFRPIARLVATGEILEYGQRFSALSDYSIEVVDNPRREEPPQNILEALGKLTLYRLQERAQEALKSGDVDEATKRLQRLATRLFERGETELAHAAQAEAQRVANTSHLSERGRMTLKYHTRYLLVSSVGDDNTQ